VFVKAPPLGYNLVQVLYGFAFGSLTDMAKQRQAVDKKYLEIILNRIRICREYKPAFGQGRKVSLQEFQRLYGSDPFYSWFGLDDPLMYAAHRAAGGITSIYRQIGVGCEELFRQILQDHFGLNETQAKWSYEIVAPGGRKRKLSLDGRAQLSDIVSEPKRMVVHRWLAEASTYLQVAPEVAGVLKGAVFEVRQGYKSKDSKRQNADIANAAAAYSQGYLPVLVLLSTQIDSDMTERYEHAKWLLLQGHLGGSSVRSTYAFVKKVIGYDLAGFFQHNSPALKDTITEVLQTLLKADGASG
jgi:hypothetical protein